ncbi:MAG: hypothetical protein ACT4NY_34040 [Pseudonocardiales bacterium]
MSRREGWVVGEPSDLLRGTRERTESPRASGDHLSREELADLINAWLFEQARLGDVQDAVRAVGTADEAFSHARPVEDPPWMAS